MNRTRALTFIAGTAVLSIAAVAAPAAAQAAPPAPTKTHTTIAGWGHNLPGGVPVAIHGNSMNRSITIKPGGVRTLEINDYTCKTVGGQAVCGTRIIETVRTNAKGQINLTLPVHAQVDSYAIFVRESPTATTAETAYWGVYKA